MKTQTQPIDHASFAVWLAAIGLVCGDVAAQDPASESADQIAALRSARDALVEAGDFTAARGPAEEVVATLEQTPEGPTPNDVLYVARIQAEFGEIDAAEMSYLRAADMLEVSGGEYATALISVYRALGRAYINARRFPEALAVLEQAQHISQRNEGLFNVEQSAIIDDLTMAHLGAGNTVEARSLQLQRLDNAVRRFGADDPRVIPFHAHLGDYYDQSRLRSSAREEYQTVLTLQEKEWGTDDPRLLATLRRLLQIDLLLGRGDEAKERLSQLLEQSPEADAVERILSLAVLGDWATVRDMPEQAREYYVAAYRLLEQNPRDELSALFDEPRMIDFIPPLSPFDRGARTRPYAWGSITLEFDLSATGRAFDVRTITATPPDLMDDEYVRRLRETHFRPKLVDGLPVDSGGLQFEHYFRFYVRKDD
jgi:tetratricopeptide (TPR) repeat protein